MSLRISTVFPSNTWLKNTFQTPFLSEVLVSTRDDAVPIVSVEV